MTKFHYTAMDGTGREHKGTVSAVDEREVGEQLKRQGLFPTAVAALPVANRAAPGGRSAVVRSAPRWWARLLQPRIKAKPLCVLTRQMATLLGAGMPLLRALRLLTRQSRDHVASQVLTEVANRIEEGHTFSEALATHPASFSGLYVNMVRAGEASGGLEAVLERQAEYLEKNRRLRRKIKGALTYPAVVCTVALLITSGLMIFIVPKFAQVFGEMLANHPLPLLTRAVIACSNFMFHRVYVAVGAAAVVVVAYRGLRLTRTGSRLIDVVLLRLPVFGSLATLAAGAHFCQTLGTLIRSGVPVLQALQIVRDTCANRVVAGAVQQIHDAVKEGEAMSGPLAATRVFPPMLVGMVEVGEETGALPEMLARVAEVYEEEVDNAVDALTALIEPAMIVFLAAVVGTIVVALFMPLVVLLNIGSGGG